MHRRNHAHSTRTPPNIRIQHQRPRRTTTQPSTTSTSTNDPGTIPDPRHEVRNHGVVLLVPQALLRSRRNIISGHRQHLTRRQKHEVSKRHARHQRVRTPILRRVACALLPRPEQLTLSQQRVPQHARTINTVLDHARPTNNLTARQRPKTPPIPKPSTTELPAPRPRPPVRHARTNTPANALATMIDPSISSKRDIQGHTKKKPFPRRVTRGRGAVRDHHEHAGCDAQSHNQDTAIAVGTRPGRAPGSTRN